VRVGVLHPVTGALAYSGQQCRAGALMAIDDINKAGGIKSLGGAKFEPMLGDAQSSPAAGTAEVEKMNEAGVSAIVGAYASAICLATTQAAAKYNLPHVVDVGVADQIVERGLKNTFRFAPGYKKVSEVAMNNLFVLNTAAGKPARTVMIVHEESLFGTGTANLLQRELPGFGFEVKEVVKHANPTRDFNNIVLRMKAVNPDIVIPANYYNEYVLLVRTMQQQKVRPKAIFSVLGGGASSYKFVKEFPQAADGIIDCNHWFNPKDKRSFELKKRTEAKGLFYSYEVFLTYTAMRLLADAVERAKSTDRAAIIQALETSTFSDHFMPYGPTKFVGGQNTGAQPLMTQVLDKDIKVIVPRDYRQAEPVFPLKA
jgi:branched-chain amino acid transport system substrate-binding protein